jgi:hypothetical protein
MGETDKDICFSFHQISPKLATRMKRVTLVNAYPAWIRQMAKRQNAFLVLYLSQILSYDN